MTVSAISSAVSLYDPSSALRTISLAVRTGGQVAGASQEPAGSFKVDTATELPVQTPSATSISADISPVSSAGTTGSTAASSSTQSLFPMAKSDSLLVDLQNYAKTSSQGSSLAFQEYAKAWGGRVVHGTVELPPLSVYSE